MTPPTRLSRGGAAEADKDIESPIPFALDVVEATAGTMEGTACKDGWPLMLPRRAKSAAAGVGSWGVGSVEEGRNQGLEGSAVAVMLHVIGKVPFKPMLERDMASMACRDGALPSSPELLPSRLPLKALPMVDVPPALPPVRDPRTR